MARKRRKPLAEFERLPARVRRSQGQTATESIPRDAGSGQERLSARKDGTGAAQGSACEAHGASSAAARAPSNSTAHGRQVTDPPRNAAGVREAWIDWLAPIFPAGSAYITGTYRDEYGFANGLTLPRNVHKDVGRFINHEEGWLRIDDRRYICGVEQHRYRDILHWHGIIEGPFTADELRWLRRLWLLDRGYARVLPVRDGCISYVTKYALKANDSEAFDWRL